MTSSQGKRFSVLFIALVLGGALSAQEEFVNWENPHVHPLDMTPDGTRLLAVNTADNRLEVFDLTGSTVEPLFAVQVGLDPVSVRARTNDEVWVVNHISDSVSIVDLGTQRVVATLETDDEPADVVFAGLRERAFVSCSQANTVLVFDPTDPGAGPLERLEIRGEDPRALAISPGGRKVYVAVFESGNKTTVLAGGNNAFPPNIVSNPIGPYGGANPPPNDGNDFRPPKNPESVDPPNTALIIKERSGRWFDDNGTDWSRWVNGAEAQESGRLPGWTLLDHDVAVIDTASLDVSYVTGLMNLCMALAVNPASGMITVIGTDATNEIRFEPNISGTFVRVLLARVQPGLAAGKPVVDLNSHLTYATPTIPQDERDKSIGDPRGIVWESSGKRGYVTGMGSNNVVVIDAEGKRAGLAPTIEVGEGPTGIVLDETRERLYVLNKFEAAVSVIDTKAEGEIDRVPYFDPTTDDIRTGRRHLYDTHETSGLGHAACASCHVDSRTDHLGWDLGDPRLIEQTVEDVNRGGGIPFLNFFDRRIWHTMKGPHMTQTLQDIIGHEPLHWRGDRRGLEEFNQAFEGLQGDDAQLTPAEMQEFEDFLDTISIPPNPFRTFENELKTDLPLPGHFATGDFENPAGTPLPNGDAQNGLALFRPPNKLEFILACVTCHSLPTGAGTNYFWQGDRFVEIPPGRNGELHHLVGAGLNDSVLKVPQLRTLYEKTGLNMTQVEATTGFGILRDGSMPSIERFMSLFEVDTDQQVADLTAFMLSFSGSDLPVVPPTEVLEPPGTPSQDTHAAVGKQTTLEDQASAPPEQLQRIAAMLSLADDERVGLVVKGLVAGEHRGYAYDVDADLFQSDRAAETISATDLAALAQPGAELTYTVVPWGSEVRIGVDRDRDGFFDRDEIDQGTDPADPSSHP